MLKIMKRYDIADPSDEQHQEMLDWLELDSTSAAKEPPQPSDRASRPLGARLGPLRRSTSVTACPSTTASIRTSRASRLATRARDCSLRTSEDCALIRRAGRDSQE